MKNYEPLRLRFRVAFGLPRFYDHDRIRESVKEHLTILEAIECGDGQAARRLICDHLTKGPKVRTRIFNSLAGYTPNNKTFDWEHET